MQRGFVTITNSTVQGNIANRHGGALFLGTWTGDKDATQNMKDVASYYNSSSRAALIVANSTIADNQAQSNGGKSASEMPLFRCTAAMHPPCEVFMASVFANLPVLASLLCAPTRWLHAAAWC